MPRSKRVLARLLFCVGLTVLAACQGGGKAPAGTNSDSPSDDYTVSYRSLVRVPSDGAVMKHQAFVDQVNRLDPISAKRCPVSNDVGFQLAVDALGGITWTHPVAILKDRGKPPLYRGRIPPQPLAVPGTASAGAGAKDAAAPTITRPDLVGYQENTAIFLSQRHGLMAVKTDGPKPVLSCALKLPGQPKYFFYKGNELVLLVNGLSVAEAALLRFRVSPTGFDFVDTVMLDHQQVQDARLFDSTLVVYSNLLTPIVGDSNTPPPPATSPVPGTTGVAPSGGASVGGGAGAAVDVRSSRTSFIQSTGIALTAIKWASALTVAWHEEFVNDPVAADPFAGQDAVMAATKMKVGDVVATTKNFKPFISASDRYVVVSRDVNRTIFTGTQTQTYSYCAASHESPARSVQYCSPQYEQRPNPDYKDPKSTKGDYSCNGKTLLACIQEAAPTVSRYIYVRVGQTCNTYTYHDYVCDRYANNVVSYPTFRTEQATQFVVYRYDAGDFVKLDDQIYEMADPGTGASAVDSLTFNGKPLEVAGSIDHKGDLQFQHGHFYVLTNQGEQLHTLLLVGNSIAKLGTQSTPRQKASNAYSGAHSTLFSDNRMMVSRAYTDYQNPIPTWSDVIMLDLTAASFPKALNQFVMPGSSDQLILAADGVIGPGTVAFTSGGVARNLQKLTLFDRDNAGEIGNLLLGTEFNADMISSWLGVADDQRIRLDDDSQRLFLPYSGYHHAPQDVFNPVAHRLNITEIANQLLTSETTFDLAEDIIRTVSTSSLPNAGSALAFGDSSVYAINQTAGDWALDVVEEYATPIATYRISDVGDVYARIDRVGARCQISTFPGASNAFRQARLGTGPQIPCGETSQPMGIGLTVVFPDSSTGWQITADGRAITALSAAAVNERLTHIRNDVYCALDGGVEDGTPVPYLDAVPPSVVCFPFGTGGGYPRPL